MSENKRYEDFTDEDVADVLASREENKKAKVEIPAGIYYSRVKVQRDVPQVPEKGIFSGAIQVLVGLVPLTNPEDASSELKQGIIWYRMALPLAAAGKKITGQARGIAVGALQALGVAPRTDDEEADIKEAVEVAKRIADGEQLLPDNFVYVDVSYSPWTTPQGETKQNTNVRLYGKLAKGKTLTPISEAA